MRHAQALLKPPERYFNPPSSGAVPSYTQSKGVTVAAEIVHGRNETESGTETAQDLIDPAFALHRGGKMEVRATVPVRDADDLSLAYTPGVAKVCSAIAEQPGLVHDYTWKSQVVAVVTDGTAVLGLGDIGPEASLPVMEEIGRAHV